MTVKRCICSDVTFAELKEVADAKSITTIEKLQQDRPFGRSCKLCIPYVRQMLKDGTTEFHRVITE
jgi:bacterioferritin-associated ferredoxin